MIKVAASKYLGQVAQLVEHGPEKAGVGGSSPPLTTPFYIQRKPAFPKRAFFVAIDNIPQRTLGKTVAQAIGNSLN